MVWFRSKDRPEGPFTQQQALQMAVNITKKKQLDKLKNQKNGKPNSWQSLTSEEKKQAFGVLGKVYHYFKFP